MRWGRPGSGEVEPGIAAVRSLELAFWLCWSGSFSGWRPSHTLTIVIGRSVNIMSNITITKCINWSMCSDIKPGSGMVMLMVRVMGGARKRL